MAKALSVSRSNLYERPELAPEKRGPYTKIDDEELLPYIIEIVDSRPTYGYRRVGALLNRKLQEDGKPGVNHKRVYRLMKTQGLLLVKAPQRHNSRAHNGKIETDESDKRWCSDGFEISCDNGEKARVIFVLDCCDREIISYFVSSGGFTAEMAQYAMLCAVEKRFNNCKTSHKVELLTDNGSCFIAKDTFDLAQDIGITNCFTPVRSPESNGMAEAFVRTIKRDYVNVAEIPNAAHAIRQLSKWIEDYNEFAPHKGLKMLSPRQYRRKQKALLEEISPGAAQAQNAA